LKNTILFNKHTLSLILIILFVFIVSGNVVFPETAFVDTFSTSPGESGRTPFLWSGLSKVWSLNNGILRCTYHNEDGKGLQAILSRERINITAGGTWTLEVSFRHISGSVKNSAYETIVYLLFPPAEEENSGEMYLLVMKYKDDEKALFINNGRVEHKVEAIDLTGDFHQTRITLDNGQVSMFVDDLKIFEAETLKRFQSKGMPTLLIGNISGNETPTVCYEFDYIAFTDTGAYLPGDTQWTIKKQLPYIKVPDIIPPPPRTDIEVPVLAGYKNDDSIPLTGTAANYGETVTVAFDYERRSIFIKAAAVTRVSSVIITDSLKDDGGAVRFAVKSNLQIYSSADNITWEKYDEPFEYSVQYRQFSNTFECINIDGLDIVTRYLKIHYTQNNNTGWDLGLHLEKSVRVYTRHAVVNNTISFFKTDPYLTRERNKKDVENLNLIVKTTNPEYCKNLRLNIFINSPLLPRPLKIIHTQIKLTNNVPLSSTQCPDGLFEVRAELFDTQLKTVVDVVNEVFLCVIKFAIPEAVSLKNNETYLFDKNSIRVIGKQFPGNLNTAGGNYVLFSGEKTNEIICEKFIGYFSSDKLPLFKDITNETTEWIRVQCINVSYSKWVHNYKNGIGKKLLIYNNDGYSDFAHPSNPIENIEQVRYQAGRYKGTDCTGFDWCVGTQAVNFPSKYADLIGAMTDKDNGKLRTIDKKAIMTFNNFISNGTDIMKVLKKETAELGIDFNVSYRVQGTASTEDWHFLSKYFYEHSRDLVLPGRDSYLSYAYPGYQDYLLKQYEEVLGLYGANGLNLDFCRYPQVIGTEEEPVLRRYFEISGLKNKPSAGDPILTKVRASIMTDFIRRVHLLCKKHETAQKKKITLSVRFPFKDYYNYGLDVDTWVKEKIVDTIIPSTLGLASSIPDPFDKFPALVKNTGVLALATCDDRLGGNDLSKEEEEELALAKKQKRSSKIANKMTTSDLNLYMARALSYYTMGFDGLYIFNNWKGYEILHADLGNEYRVKLFNIYERLLKNYKYFY